MATAIRAQTAGDPDLKFRDRFAAELRHDIPASPVVGLEHEFVVRLDGAQVDFRWLLPTLAVPGRKLDPGDVHAYRTESGLALTCDGPEAEYASPPLAVQPGVGAALRMWSGVGGGLLSRLLGPAYRLEGCSTHLSVSLPDPHSTETGLYFARTFAPALMLLMDGRDSPGLLVRPRHRRLELGGDYITGPALEASGAMAIGGVLACLEAVEARRPRGSLPPVLDVEVAPAVDRFGWYVDRAAFGTDLYDDGRAALLRRRGWGKITGQDHLALCWQIAVEALEGRLAGPDLAAGHAMVKGDLPLPVEAERGRLPGGGGTDPATDHGRLLAPRRRPGFIASAILATWDFTVFVLKGERRAYACVPRRSLGRFLRLLDEGAFDQTIAGFLATPPTGLTLDTHARTDEPGLYDELGPRLLLAAPERGADGVLRLASLGGGGARRSGTGNPSGPAAAADASVRNQPIAPGSRPGKGIGTGAPPPVSMPGGWRSAWKWIIGGAGVVIAMTVTLLLVFGGSDDTPEAEATLPASSTTEAAVPPAGQEQPVTSGAEETIPGPATEDGTPAAAGEPRIGNCDDPPSEEALGLGSVNVVVDGVPGTAPASAVELVDPMVHAPCDGYSAAALESAGGPYPLCAGGCPPIYLVSPGLLAIDHSESIPDAVTGESGLSLWELMLLTNLPPGTEIQWSAQCGSQLTTGAGTVGTEGVVVAEGPLFAYGECSEAGGIAVTPDGAVVVLPSVLPSFVVGSEESTLDPSAVIEAAPFDWPAPTLDPDALAATLDPAHGLLGALSGTEPADLAMPISLGGDLLTLQTTLIRNTAGTSDDGAGFPVMWVSSGENGFGTFTSSVLTTEAGAVVAELLFNNTVFPCGPGRVGYTVCPDAPGEITSGRLAVTSIVLEEPLPLEGSESLVIGFAFDADGNPETGTPLEADGPSAGTDTVYLARYIPGSGWVLEREGSAGTIAARVVIRNSAAALVAPFEEFGGRAPAAYRVFASPDQEQPILAIPPIGFPPIPIDATAAPIELPVLEAPTAGEEQPGDAAPGTTGTATPQASETVEQFAALYAKALASGDAQFLLDRLHPVALQLSDEETCREFIAAEVLAITSYQLTGDVEGPTRRTFNTPDGAVTVEEFFEAPLRTVYRGQTFEMTGAYALVGNEMHWFSECRLTP